MLDLILPEKLDQLPIVVAGLRTHPLAECFPFQFPKGTLQTSDLCSNPSLQVCRQEIQTSTEPSWPSKKGGVVSAGVIRREPDSGIKSRGL